MNIPEPRSECRIYKEIDAEILRFLKALEWYNDKMLEQFWSLNLEP